jgi:neutral ceramidase
MNVWVKRFLITFIILAGILFSLIGPIDRTPLHDQSFYQDMHAQLDSLAFEKSGIKTALYAGWNKVAITPDHPMAMAGYRLREGFETVHDSLYARIIVLNTGGKPCYLISVDLLLFPPTLKQKLIEHFSKKEKQPFLYLSATHTHNGIGCWHDTTVGNVVLGNYEEAWVEETAKKIIHSIESIESKQQPTSLAYWETDAHEYAENRLKPDAPHDGLLRGLKLARADSTTAHLVSFSAHATSISKKSRSLSGDYPAALVDSLMKSTNSFGMFMAGMVGSHRLAGIDAGEFDLVAKAGQVLSEKVRSASVSPKADSITLIAAHIPIKFGPSQLRITKDWKLRNWVFSWLVNPLHGELTYLQLNDIVLIGTPCDFSGEIFVKHIAEVAAQQNKKVIITSFNGDYAGYITEDEHYETLKKEEVMALNWVGPYYGSYFTEMINTLLKK